MAVVHTTPRRRRPRRVLAWPSTTLGRWSALGAACAVAGFAYLAALASVDAADRGGLARGVVIAAGLVTIATAISSGVTAVVAVVRGDRSLVLAAPLLVGAFWLLFLLGELLFPH